MPHTSPEAVKLNLRLPRSLHAELSELAQADGVSLNVWMVSALARQAETHIAISARLLLEREDRRGA